VSSELEKQYGPLSSLFTLHSSLSVLIPSQYDISCSTKSTRSTLYQNEIQQAPATLEEKSALQADEKGSAAGKNLKSGSYFVNREWKNRAFTQSSVLRPHRRSDAELEEFYVGSNL
jgi:hypothetical protein